MRISLVLASPMNLQEFPMDHQKIFMQLECCKSLFNQYHRRYQNNSLITITVSVTLYHQNHKGFFLGNRCSARVTSAATCWVRHLISRNLSRKSCTEVGLPVFFQLDLQQETFDSFGMLRIQVDHFNSMTSLHCRRDLKSGCQPLFVTETKTLALKSNLT